jgi:hypothetical protein
MKSFKAFQAEAFDFPMAHTSEDGKHEQGRSRNLHDPDFRAQLNVVLLRVTDGLYNNPWTALNNAAKQLGFYGIQLPKVNFPDVNGGEVVWRVDPYANLVPDYSPPAGSENDTEEKIFFYFEYQLTETGRYICYAEIVNDSTLDGYLNDSTVKEELVTETIEDHHERLVNGMANGKGFQKTFESAAHQKKWVAAQKDVVIHNMQRIHEGSELNEADASTNELTANLHRAQATKRADRAQRAHDKGHGTLHHYLSQSAAHLSAAADHYGAGRTSEGNQSFFKAAALHHDAYNWKKQWNVKEDLDEGLIMNYVGGENQKRAEVHKDPDYGAFHVKTFKNNTLVNHHKNIDIADRAHDLAKKFVKEEEELDETTKSQLAKKAHAGKDIGKPGKNFKKVADKAAKEYGSKKAGEKVAAAAMWKNIKHEELEVGDEVDILDEGYKVGDMVNVTNYKAKPQYKITGKTKTHYSLSHNDKPHGDFPKARIARVNKAAWAHRTGKPIPTQHKAAKYDDHGHAVRESEMSDEKQSLFELSPTKMLQYVAKSARDKKDRVKGMDKVAKKLKVEETEQIDELSREKSLQYVAKAARSTKDRTKGIEKAGKKAIGEDGDEKPTKRLLYFHELSNGTMMKYVAKAARSTKDRQKGLDKVKKKVVGEEIDSKKKLAENHYENDPNEHLLHVGHRISNEHDHLVAVDDHKEAMRHSLKKGDREGSANHFRAMQAHKRAHETGEAYEAGEVSHKMYNQDHESAKSASRYTGAEYKPNKNFTG